VAGADDADYGCVVHDWVHRNAVASPEEGDGVVYGVRCDYVAVAAVVAVDVDLVVVGGVAGRMVVAEVEVVDMVAWP
jgi:hypothetical protein